MRHATLAACLVLVGCTEPAPGARSPEQTATPRAPAGPAPIVAGPPDSTPDFWVQELEWARARFPVLQDFTLDVDFRPLLEWVPVGKTVTLFFRAEYTLSNQKEVRYECAASEATRFESADGDDSLNLLIPGPERVEQGETLRDYVGAGVHKWGVAFGGSGGKQRKRRNGTWIDFDGYGSGYRRLGAFVGPVNGDTAHFRYATVEPHPSCGPLVEVPCDDGEPRGHNVCNACETVELELDSPLSSRSVLPRTSRQCDVPCPVVENPELQRIQRLLEHFPSGLVVWPRHLGVALYRTRAACEADTLWRRPHP